ncbi:MAG: UvrD-helicase domain-containing protein [Mycoplasmataceae bacterium]|nr:UvrD-helicase domain-containing protein [Mycoplasmataceae bacterium]
MLNLSKLNKNQKDAVTSKDGPLLIVAGAGTGKTRVLTWRVAYLVKELGYNPSRILAITFTNKAADEMRSRLNEMLSESHASWIGTYHSTCLKILKEDIGVLNRSNKFEVLATDADKNTLLREIYKAGQISTREIKYKKALAIISKIKTNNLDIYNISDRKQLEQLEIYRFEELPSIRYIYKHYSQRMLDANKLDFDDLLILAHKILSEFPTLREKWQKRFDYVLVDEFQDTNQMQYEILTMLVNPQLNNVFVVGDPDQTIYTWRGAYPNIFKDFLHTYPHNRIIVLDTNYRSTPNILHVANKLISHNMERIKKNLVTDNPEGLQVTIFGGESAYDESNFVVHQILKAIKNKDCAYKDMVILYRARQQSRAIEQELINNQVPYYVYGGTRFYERMEIMDLIGYLKVIANPNDELALKRIINVPARLIGESTVDRISEYTRTRKQTFLQSLYDSNNPDISVPWEPAKITKFLTLIDNLTEASKKLSIVNTLELVIKDTNYLEYLQSYDGFEDRQGYIDELKASISEFELKHPGAGIYDYLHEIALYTNKEEDKDVKLDKVILMTVHAAKGTEYKYVFVMGMIDGIFPSIHNFECDIEEERRVAYVAITRAKEHLFLSYNTGSSSNYCKTAIASRFIKEIGKEHVHFEFPKTVSISNKDLDWFDSQKEVDFSDNYHEKNIDFHIGDTIVHTVYGLGAVIGIDKDMIDVVFKNPHGKKRLMKNHKSIKRMLN